MAHNDREIEIHVRVEKPKNLLAFLEKHATFKFENRQIDEYFTPAHRDFLSVRPAIEWLRVRESGGKTSLDYKHWKMNKKGTTTHCDEYKCKVESMSQIKKILKPLDFKSRVVVDKIRKVWHYKNYEIALDNVKKLGSFVEIEWIGTSAKADPEKIPGQMIQFLKDLKVGKLEQNHQGHPFLLLYPKEAKWIRV